MTLNELKNIGNKIVSIYYGRKESLAKIPVGKVFKEKDDYIVFTANQIRNKFMIMLC